MAETDRFKSFSIEPRGGELVVVFQLCDEEIVHQNHAGGGIRELKKTEAAFNEKSLAGRVAALEHGGFDASVSREALTRLRITKGNVPSNG
jgi:hypothetical protein